jgi:hypothetical protein
MLQLGDGIRRPHVLFAADAEGVFAAGIEHLASTGSSLKALVRADGFFRHFENTDAFDIATACR